MSKYVAVQLFTLDVRPAIRSQWKNRHAVPNPRISEVTRVDMTRSTPSADSSGQRSGGRNDGCGRRFTLPT
jgi:hypothetical protein